MWRRTEYAIHWTLDCGCGVSACLAFPEEKKTKTLLCVIRSLSCHVYWIVCVCVRCVRHSGRHTWKLYWENPTRESIGGRRKKRNTRKKKLFQNTKYLSIDNPSCLRYFFFPALSSLFLTLQKHNIVSFICLASVSKAKYVVVVQFHKFLLAQYTQSYLYFKAFVNIVEKETLGKLALGLCWLHKTSVMNLLISVITVENSRVYIGNGHK